MKQQTRHVLYLLILLSMGTNVSAQHTTDELLAKTWQFKMADIVKQCNRVGAIVGGGYIDTVMRGYQFRIINITEDGDYVIKFLQWGTFITMDSTKLKSYTDTVNYYRNKSFVIDTTKKDKIIHYVYFLLPKNLFDLKCEEKIPKTQLSIGAISLPIKMRFANKSVTHKVYSSFEGNISVGLSVGNKWNYKNGKWSFIALGGFALTSVAVDSASTNHFVENNTNVSAITIHAGGLVAIDNFQIGVFAGIDYLSGKINHEWDYRNKPWIGVGIGFSFFNAKKTTDTQ